MQTVLRKNAPLSTPMMALPERFLSASTKEMQRKAQREAQHKVQLQTRRKAQRIVHRASKATLRDYREFIMDLDRAGFSAPMIASKLQAEFKDFKMIHRSTVWRFITKEREARA